MNAEILSVGTELLLGNTINTDAADISEALAELGINVFWHTVVGDNPKRLTDAVGIARVRADLIITTGGLGPTCDDLTKQVLARAFGLELVFDDVEAERLKKYFVGREMTDNNYQQAYLPAGCTPLRNDWGTAPGCAFTVDGVTVIMLPGPPRECRAMLEHRVMPYLRGLSESVIVSHSLRIFGQGESAVEARLRDMMNALTNPTLAPYAKEGEVMLRITAKAESAERAEDMMAPVIRQVRDVLGDVIYGENVGSLEERVLALMRERGLTLSAAESCTGGLLAERLTSIPGASDVFAGGVVTYTNRVKNQQLGVPAELLEKYGAVSAQVAREMASRVRERLGTDMGVGITGLAGPDGDGVNPVGTVFVALADGENVYLRSLSLGKSRSRVRRLAANHALDMIRRCLTGLPVENI